METIKFKRGQIWFTKSDTPLKENSNIQQGDRPVIIISNNVGNKVSPTLIVAPCTTALKPGLPTHVTFNMTNGKHNTVLCEQIRTIDARELYNYMETADKELMSAINKALAIAIGLISVEESPAVIIDSEPITTSGYAHIEKNTLPKSVPTPKPAIQFKSWELQQAKKYAKRFTENEKTAIKKYLENHTMVQAALEFSKIMSEPVGTTYTRIAYMVKKGK